MSKLWGDMQYSVCALSSQVPPGIALVYNIVP
jgi:hypothetical protein